MQQGDGETGSREEFKILSSRLVARFKTPESWKGVGKHLKIPSSSPSPRLPVAFFSFLERRRTREAAEVGERALHHLDRDDAFHHPIARHDATGDGTPRRAIALDRAEDRPARFGPSVIRLHAFGHGHHA